MSENSENDIVEHPSDVDIKAPSEEKMQVKNSSRKMITALIVVIAIAAFASGFALAGFNNDYVTKEELGEILNAMRDSPLNPSAARQPSPTILRTVSLDDDPVKGNPNAPVTIVEFSDFQCPFCSRFFQQTLPLIEKNYVDTGKVKLVYRDFPLGFHQNAKPAHIASECANKQDAFWEYHDILFEKQSQWQSLELDIVNEQFKVYAQELGLEESSFSTCLSSAEIEQEVMLDAQDAVRYGSTGTPAFFIGNEKLGYTKITGAQPYQSFANVIESKLG